MADGERLAAGKLSEKKNSPRPFLGQKLPCFCDTTQIGAWGARSLHIPSYVSRWVTGGNPVGIYWGRRPVQAALESPFGRSRRPRFHRPGLASHWVLLLTSLSHRFVLFLYAL